VRELPQLPVGVGGAEALLDVEQGGQQARVRRRRRVEFLRIDGDAHAVPGLQPQSASGRHGRERAEVIGAGGRADLVDVPHVAPFGQGPVVLVERGQRAQPVLARRRPPERGGNGPRGDGEESAGRDARGQLGDHRLAGREVHQHPEQQHGVIFFAERHCREVPDRTFSQRNAIPHVGRLGAQRGLEDGAHLGIGFDREDPVPEAGQPDRLRALPRAHVEEPRRRLREVLIKLAGDQLLPDHVAHVVQPAEPARPAAAEGAVCGASGLARLLVWCAHHRPDGTRVRWR
jgi:hypothetical protein